MKSMEMFEHEKTCLTLDMKEINETRGRFLVLLFCTYE